MQVTVAANVTPALNYGCCVFLRTAFTGRGSANKGGWGVNRAHWNAGQSIEWIRIRLR